MQPYRYAPTSRDPLDLETHLVTLQPGVYEDGIRVHLVKTRLSVSSTELVEFEALSYAWGSPAVTHSAIVGEQDDGWPGGVLSITENLDTALRCIRYQDRPRVLWIDALCIDQSDMQQRSQQVEWMDEVYRKARRVIVFLGATDDGDSQAVDLLVSIGRCIDIKGSQFLPPYSVAFPLSPAGYANSFGRGGYGEGSEGGHTFKGSVRAVTALLRLSQNQASIKLSGKEPPPEHVDRGSSEATALRMALPAVLTVLRLLRRPWFSRLWVIQEVRSMRNPADGILQYGTKAVSWDYFRKGALTFQYLDQVHDDSHEAKLSMQSYLRSITLMLLHAEVRVSVKQFLSLHTFACSDPRDRLYGVLSLLRDNLGYSVPVDYQRSVESVFEDFQRQELRVRGLWLLPYCHHNPQSDWRAPSWVPNQLSFPTHVEELKDVPTYRFATGFDFVDDKYFRVWGRRVATVRAVIKIPPIMDSWDSVDDPAFMLDWLYR